MKKQSVKFLTLALACCLLFSLFPSCAAGPKPLVTGDLDKDTESFDKLLTKYIAELEETYDGFYYLVGIASKDFTVDLTNPANVDPAVATEFDSALLEVLQSSAKSILTARDLMEVSAGLERTVAWNKIESLEFASAVPPELLLSASTDCPSPGPLLIVGGLFVAGCSAFKLICNGLEKRAKPAEVIIDRNWKDVKPEGWARRKGSPQWEQWEAICQELDLNPERTTAEAVKMELRNLPIRERAKVAGHIVDIDGDRECYGQEEARESFARTAVECGKAGVGFTAKAYGGKIPERVFKGKLKDAGILGKTPPDARSRGDCRAGATF